MAISSVNKFSFYYYYYYYLINVPVSDSFIRILTIHFLLYPMRSMGESIGIGLEASSTSKGPQAKTTEPMDSTNLTYCSIELG